jgi:hypothetical protein
VVLFIVPCERAGIKSGRAAANALRSTSVIRCDVSTFPAATAAGGRALTTLPSGSSRETADIEPPQAVPAKSMRSVDPCTPSWTRMRIGPEPKPSSSRKSSAV